MAAAAAEPGGPLPNGMALPTSAADTIRAVLDHRQRYQQQQQLLQQQVGRQPVGS